MVLYLVWSMDKVRALDIVYSHESRCLNGKSRIEESDVLNKNRQRSEIPNNPLA